MTNEQADGRQHPAEQTTPPTTFRGSDDLPHLYRCASHTSLTAQHRFLLALRLRHLPPTAGEAHSVRDHDRLDALAHAGFADGTRFWHIADANTALDARQLTATVGATLKLPKS